MQFLIENTLIKKRVGDILLTVGIFPHLDGYKYIVKGVADCVENPTLIRKMKAFLYPSIAQEFGRTTTQVERSIRHAIEHGWNKGRFMKLNDIFRVNVIDHKENFKPQNSEFIALLADRIMFEIAEEIRLGRVDY